MAGNANDMVDWGHDVEIPVSYTVELGFYSKDPRH